MRNARAALELQPQALPEAWALLALLLSAQRQISLAAASADAALPHAPPALLQLLLKIKARVLAASGTLLRSIGVTISSLHTDDAPISAQRLC